MNKLVIVYGSLREGMGNHRVLGGAKKMGQFTIPEGVYYMVSLGGFPGLIPHRGGSEIVAEVYSCNEEQYQAVEWLEGYPNFYDREKIDTPWGEGEVYTLDDSYADHKQVFNGDWCNPIYEEEIEKEMVA